MIKHNLVIIGGGPAGLAAAVSAYDNGVKSILIIEREEINNRFTMEKAWEVIKEDFGVVE